MVAKPRHVETKGKAHNFTYTTNQMGTPLTLNLFPHHHFYHFLQLQPIRHTVTNNTFIHFTNYQLPITNYLSLSPACHLPQTNPFLLLLSLHPYKNNTTWLFCFVPIQEAWKSLRVVQVGITVTAAVDHQSATWLKTTSLLFSSSSP